MESFVLLKRSSLQRKEPNQVNNGDLESNQTLLMSWTMNPFSVSIIITRCSSFAFDQVRSTTAVNQSDGNSELEEDKTLECRHSM